MQIWTWEGKFCFQREIQHGSHDKPTTSRGGSHSTRLPVDNQGTHLWPTAKTHHDLNTQLPYAAHSFIVLKSCFPVPYVTLAGAHSKTNIWIPAKFLKRGNQTVSWKRFRIKKHFQTPGGQLSYSQAIILYSYCKEIYVHILFLKNKKKEGTLQLR